MTRLIDFKEQKILESILDYKLSLFWEDVRLSHSQKRKFKLKLAKLKAGLPLDYVIGRVKIDHLDLKLNKNVLIPRPETIEWLKIISSKLSSEQTVLDVGCGSGLIGLYIASRVNQVVLSDISKKALRVAKQNAENNQISNTKFFQSDLLQNYKLQKCLKLSPRLVILANLPYLPRLDKSIKSQNNVQHEPALALYSGLNGLDLFVEFVNQLSLSRLNFELIVFELDPRNIAGAKIFLMEKFPDYNTNYNLNILKDSQNLERCLYLEKV